VQEEIVAGLAVADVVLDRAGHNGQIEQSAVFETLVEEWLDRSRA